MMLSSYSEGEKQRHVMLRPLNPKKCSSDCKPVSKKAVMLLRCILLPWEDSSESICDRQDSKLGAKSVLPKAISEAAIS